MRTLALAALGAGMVAALGTGPVRADSYWEVEAARANARAGGPVSERDAELLERYGCLSGTQSPFCRQLEHGKRTDERSARKRLKYRN